MASPQLNNHFPITTMNDEPDTNPDVPNVDISNPTPTPTPTPKPNKPRGSVTISLDPDTIKEIDQIARNNLRSRGNMIRFFIMSSLARAKKTANKDGEISFTDFI